MELHQRVKRWLNSTRFASSTDANRVEIARRSALAALAAQRPARPGVLVTGHPHVVRSPPHLIIDSLRWDHL